MAVYLSTLATRAGVLMYPNEAAGVLADDPPLSTDPVITDEVLATREGCLRFPDQAAAYIAEIAASESSSSSI